MNSNFLIFKKLPIDRNLLSLSDGEIDCKYFCYPLNALPIGFEGCILYCFLPEYGDMVFASNPESCTDQYIYPLAKSFNDFLRLILACGSATSIEQIIWMNKEQFLQHLHNEKQSMSPEKETVLAALAKELNLEAMESPFEYVKELQKRFDGRYIQFSDEYYDILGIDPPEKQADHFLWDSMLQKQLPHSFIDNFTDFNDSNCFTYYIGTDGCYFKLGSKGLHDFLDAGHTAYYIKLQISNLSPLICINFCKYTACRTIFEISENPYTAEQAHIHSLLLKFANEYHFRVTNVLSPTEKPTSDVTLDPAAYCYYFEIERED